MAQSTETVGNQIFVRNIAYKTVGEALSQAFAQFGRVTGVRIITERRYDEVRSLGFGFVDFATPEAATAAANYKDPIVVDGRTLGIRPARP
jgi:RNA recognition motif-containing protein